ncbi:MAG: hypothetical protein QM703_17785 [Gemmatales bacterium]
MARAPTGRDRIAQGNALGFCMTAYLPSSPEGAVRDVDRVVVRQTITTERDDY